MQQNHLQQVLVEIFHGQNLTMKVFSIKVEEIIIASTKIPSLLYSDREVSPPELAEDGSVANHYNLIKIQNYNC